MNHNGFVASTNLDFSDFKNDINHSFDTRAATTRSPVGDVKLTHLLNRFSLRERANNIILLNFFIIIHKLWSVAMEVFVTDFHHAQIFKTFVVQHKLWFINITDRYAVY